jgi:hypothetical protein
MTCNLFKVLLLFAFGLKSYAAICEDSIAGKWRGAIIGHTDNRDYFIYADVDSVRKEEYAFRLKIFSGDYSGEFVLATVLRENGRLYISDFRKTNEFPYSIPHMEDCFTGYFQIRRDTVSGYVLDLYRNAVYRTTDSFTHRDTAGNYIPDFECFTSVLLRPVGADTTYASLEKHADSILSDKRRTQEFAKRRVLSSKEWTVKNENITLQVWDNNKQDSDVISLKFNDEWILTKFLLKKEKYTIHLSLKQKENRLLLFAENLGTIPPNTAAISIDDDQYIRTFMLNSDMSKSEAIKIILMK